MTNMGTYTDYFDYAVWFAYGQGMTRPHGAEPRGLNARIALSPLHEGRFGRLFRRLPPAPWLPDEELQQVAETMRETNVPGGGWGGAADTGDNPSIPAGYTYLGQFIDHDITFDPQSRLDKENDPDALVDFRTPRFDLDSVYGSGPDDEPFQYSRDSGRTRMLIGANSAGDEDLPRNVEDTALIGDPRNDENTIVGQLHLLFLKLHNKLMDQLDAEGALAPELRFDEARRLARWHYQWIVVEDYLPRVCGRDLLNKLWTTDPVSGLPEIRTRFYRPTKRPYMPVEFSVAAYRFGHSQIRGIYNLSDLVTDRPIFIAGPLPDEFADLRGFRALPQQWTVDWTKFFAIDGSSPQPSRKIDAKLTPGLFDLPDGGGSLAFRNVKRGQALGLPSGQDVARAVNPQQVLTGTELSAPEPTPLWFYILKESELLAGGEHLGPVGGRIVAEVLLGLLRGDSQSFYGQQPDWRPTLPDADGDGRFTMADLVKFVTG